MNRHKAKRSEWIELQSDKLSVELQTLLKKLEEHQEVMEDLWGGAYHSDFEGNTNWHKNNKNRLSKDVRKMDSLVFKAYRLGARSHPSVVKWLNSLRNLGQVEVLRKMRTKRKRFHLEKGVKPPVPLWDLELRYSIKERLEKGTSLEAIRIAIKERKIKFKHQIPSKYFNISPKGFTKLVRRLLNIDKNETVVEYKGRLSKDKNL